MQSLKNRKMVYVGNVLKLGDNINTDVLHPSEFFSLNSDTVKTGFMKGVKGYCEKSDDHIIVAGSNLGCGSSRETTAYAFRLNGIKVIVAASFSRIFYRNMVNNGIIPITQPKLYEHVLDGDVIEVDFSDMKIALRHKDLCFKIEPFDDYIIKLINCGGMVNYLKELMND